MAGRPSGRRALPPHLRRPGRARPGLRGLRSLPRDFLFEGGEAAGRPYGEDYTANRYHQPADEFAEDWRLDGITRSAEILHEVGARLAASSGWPNWREGNEFRALRDAMMKK